VGVFGNLNGEHSVLPLDKNSLSEGLQPKVITFGLLEHNSPNQTIGNTRFSPFWK
jgi:hypothetical protein